jgi:predicted nucleotidyltransferase
MTTRQDVDALLKRQLPRLRRDYKVARIGVFGSFARGEQTETSDVDILVEFSAPVGWEFIDLKDDLEALLGRRVDLVTVPALKPQLKAGILSEVVFA